MSQAWSNPVPYDLTRTPRRASIPTPLANRVPETPGTYVIYRLGQKNPCDAIVDIGETGPCEKSTPHGLRGRLATTVAHSASENIAADMNGGTVSDDLRVVWLERDSKDDAKQLQDALVTLFRKQCGRQPVYNTKRENHAQPQPFEPFYRELKEHIGCT